MAVLQKGHFGKGHLQEKNPAQREEQEENKEKKLIRTSKTVRE